MAHENLPDKFQAGRVILTQEHPYLSSAIYRVIPVAKPGLGTMAVDAWWRLYFDPTCDWSPRMVSTVLYHEIQHLLRDHPARALGIANVDHKAFNVAADCEINDDVVEELGNKASWPFPPCLPTTVFKPPQPDGLMAEEYYNAIPEDPNGRGSGQPKAGGGKCGSAGGGC